MIPSHLAVPGLLLALAACGSSDAVPEGFLVRDSAGIRIVENSVPDAATPRWLLSAEPVLVLGALDATDERQQFIGVDAVARFGDGSIVVMDSRGRALRRFSATGLFLHDIARGGSGPGEFGRLDRFVRTGDTVGVHDRGREVMTSWLLDGTPVGSFTVRSRLDSTTIPGQLVSIAPVPWKRWRDGRWVADLRSISISGMTTGVRMDSVDIWVVDTTGNFTLLRRVLHGQSWSVDLPSGIMMFGDMPFGPVGARVATDSSIVTTAGETFELQEYGSTGNLLRLLRVARTPALITSEDRAWASERYLEGEGERLRDPAEAALAWLPWRQRMAGWDALVRDDGGWLWVRIPPGRDTIATWDILDADGRLAATAQLPARLTIHQIGPDWLLGVRKGELDEPLVVLYRLERYR